MKREDAAGGSGSRLDRLYKITACLLDCAHCCPVCRTICHETCSRREWVEVASAPVRGAVFAGLVATATGHGRHEVRVAVFRLHTTAGPKEFRRPLPHRCLRG